MLELFFENTWRWTCGLPEIEVNHIPYEKLVKSEWSDEFEKKMRERLIMGALRYGCIGAKNKPQYDRINSIMKRLKKYQETGNKEFLVDSANLCLLEYVECNHPNQHFSSISDGNQIHVEKI